MWDDKPDTHYPSIAGRITAVVRTGSQTEVIMVPETAIAEGRASATDLFVQSRVGSSVGLRRASSVTSRNKNVGEVHHNRFAPHHQSKMEETPEYGDEVEKDFATFLASGGGPGARGDKS